MRPARFLSVQSVPAHQLAELQEIRYPARLLQRLVQLGIAPRHVHVAPVLGPDLRNPTERVLQSRVVARHPAVVPHQLAQLAMERIDRALALYLQKSSRIRGYLRFDAPAFRVAR